MLYLGMEVSSLMRRASRVALVVKNLTTDIGDVRDSDSALGSGRSPGRGHGNPLQYFCLENPMDRGAWRAPVLGVAESDTAERLSVHVRCSAVITVECDEDQAGIRPRLSRVLSFPQRTFNSCGWEGTGIQYSCLGIARLDLNKPTHGLLTLCFCSVVFFLQSFPSPSFCSADSLQRYILFSC